MTIKHSTDGTAIVDTTYYWQPMSTCPKSAKVQLLSEHGVAMYGSYTGKDTTWQGWAPLPKKRKEEIND